MTTAPALRPCPFCGGHKLQGHPIHLRVECIDCYAAGPETNSGSQAIAAWNARPGGDEVVRSALSIACDRLQEFLDTFGDMRDYVTQSDIDDWRKNALRTQGAAIREAEAAGEARGRAMERNNDGR